MNLVLTMVDTDTGEILGRKSANYALNFYTKNDAGFEFLMRWVQSSVRGVRIAKHSGIELRIHFSEEIESEFIPFGVSKEEVTDIIKSYVR